MVLPGKISGENLWNSRPIFLSILKPTLLSPEGSPESIDVIPVAIDIRNDDAEDSRSAWLLHASNSFSSDVSSDICSFLTYPKSNE